MATATPSLGHFCASCVSEGKTQPADVYCATCGQYQCIECSDVHSVFQFMSGHDLKPLQHNRQTPQRKAFASETNVKLKQYANVDELSVCRLHGKTLDVYCCRHREMCCSVCIVERHLWCLDKCGLEEYAKQTKIDSGVFHQKVLALRDKLHKMTENTKRCGTALDGKIENLRKQLNATKTRLDEKVMLSVKRIVAQMQETQNKEFTTELAVKGVPVATILTRCQETFLRYKSISLRGNVSECFKAYVHFHNSVKRNISDLKGAQAYVTDVSVAMNRPMSTFHCDSNAFVVTYTKRVPSNVDCICCNAQVTQPLVMEQIKHVELAHILNTESPVNLIGVAFLPDNRIVAVDKYNRLVILLTTNLEVLVTAPLQYHPHDITVLTSSEIVVALGRLQMMSFDKNSNIKAVKLITHDFSYYDSVCVLDKDTLIAGSGWRKATAVKVNVRTEKVSQFSKNAPHKEYKLNETTAKVEYISAKNVLVVTYWLKDKIDFWPVDDSASIKTVTHPKIKQPEGMCVGPMDCVFVCCYNSHKVVQITHDAQIVCFYPMTNLLYPVAISVSKDHSKLVITSQFKGRRIGIFALKALR